MKLNSHDGDVPFHDGPESGRPVLTAELRVWFGSDLTDPIDIPGWVEPEVPEEPLQWQPGSMPASEEDWSDEWRPGEAQMREAQARQAGREPVTLDGPVSLRLLSRLAGRIPADESIRELVDGLEAWQRSIGFSTARMWVEIAELHTRFTTPAKVYLDEAHRSGDRTALEDAADQFDMAERSMVAELAAAMSWSNVRARGQVEVALIMTTDLTATLDAVTGGRIEVRKAETIARALAREESDLRRLVEGEILPDAGGCSVPELRDRIRASLLRAAPELARERAERARARRAVSFHPEPDDMVRLEAMLSVLDGVRVQTALDAAAWAQKQVPGEERNLDAIRSDFLVDTIIGSGDDVSAPGPDRESGAEQGAEQSRGTGAGQGAANSAANGGGGTRQESRCSGCGSSPSPSPLSSSTSRLARRVKQALRREVVVTVGFETLTGQSDEPGYLSRYGPISAHTARMMAWEVARDGYWRCAVTDDVHGTLLGLGRSTFTPKYQPPEYLQRFANTRDRFCDFPGCRQAAAACDFDHTIPHPKGATCEGGGGKRCRSHHRLKHETPWNVRRSDDADLPAGSVVWTSPAGREYVSHPPPIGVPASRRRDEGEADTDSTGAAPVVGSAQAPGSDAWAYDPTLEELPVTTNAAPDSDWKPPPF